MTGKKNNLRTPEQNPTCLVAPEKPKPLQAPSRPPLNCTPQSESAEPYPRPGGSLQDRDGVSLPLVHWGCPDPGLRLEFRLELQPETFMGRGLRCLGVFGVFGLRALGLSWRPLCLGRSVVGLGLGFRATTPLHSTPLSSPPPPPPAYLSLNSCW